MSSPQGGKRKRFEEMKDNVVDEIYNLVITSAEFLKEVEGTSEDFISIFKTMEDRQSEFIAQAVGLNERYGNIVDLIAGKKKARVGETSSTMQSLPTIYHSNTRKFLDDTYSSLQSHTENSDKAVNNMITKFEESLEVWKKKIEDLKENTDLVAKNKILLKVQVTEFKSGLYDYDPDYDSDDSDDSDDSE